MNNREIKEQNHRLIWQNIVRYIKILILAALAVVLLRLRSWHIQEKTIEPETSNPRHLLEWYNPTVDRSDSAMGGLEEAESSVAGTNQEVIVNHYTGSLDAIADKYDVYTAEASTSLSFSGFGPLETIDGQTGTSWQINTGDCENQTLTFKFMNSISLTHIYLWLGNWRNDEVFVSDDIPTELTLILYQDGIVLWEIPLSFKSEKTAYVCELFESVQTDTIVLRIDKATSHGTEVVISEIVFSGTH